jgi:RNA polymerase primary sigma factor
MKNGIYEPSMERYLKDISGTRPCSRKDEQELFRLCRQGDPKARASLIAANMRFVLKMALQYKGCPVLSVSDLISEGALGLARAIESFDHTRGLKFISYAVWWIRSYINRAVNTQASPVRLPENQSFKIRRALREITNEGELNEEIRELIRIGERGCSLDAPLKDGSKTTLSEVLADDKTQRPDRCTEINSIEKFARELLEKLPEREAGVLRGIYGIDGKPMTLREVSESMNISRERVRQLRDHAQKSLKNGELKNLLCEKLEAQIEATG